MNKTRVQIACEKAREEGREKGREEGLEEGLLRGLRAAVTELLEARLGPIPIGFVEWLADRDSSDTLRAMLLAAGSAHSLDEFRSRAGW